MPPGTRILNTHDHIQAYERAGDQVLMPAHQMKNYYKEYVV